MSAEARPAQAHGRVAAGMDPRACCRPRTLAPAALLGAAAGSAILAAALGLLRRLEVADCWRCRTIRRPRWPR